jgi:hypothetical protein
MWLMSQSVDADIAERLLGHEVFAKVKRTYNPYSFAGERRAAMTAWVDYLTSGQAVNDDVPALPAPEPIDVEAMSVVEAAQVDTEKPRLEVVGERIVQFVPCPPGLPADPIAHDQVEMYRRIACSLAVARANVSIGRLKEADYTEAGRAGQWAAGRAAEILIQALMDWAVKFGLERTEVTARSSVAERRAELESERQEHLDLEKQHQAAAATARDMGWEEDARKAGADAAKAGAQAAAIAKTIERLPADDHFLVTRYRRGDPGSKAVRAQGVARILNEVLKIRLKHPSPSIAVAFTNAALDAGLTRWRLREREH